MQFRQTTVLAIAILLTAQSASAEVIKASGDNEQQMWVECLNDTLILNWEFESVVTTIETKHTWMFTRNVRQSGSAVDSFGNSWKFNGHFQATEHADLTALQTTSDFHLLSHDVMVGSPGGPGNLVFKTMWRISVDNGITTLKLQESDVACLP
jgi:hypothetical protein